MKQIHINVHIYGLLFLRAVLAEKIEQKVYVNLDESLPDLQILIKKYIFLKCSVMTNIIFTHSSRYYSNRPEHPHRLV